VVGDFSGATQAYQYDVRSNESLETTADCLIHV
jgi:hypothetical protein